MQNISNRNNGIILPSWLKAFILKPKWLLHYQLITISGANIITFFLTMRDGVCWGREDPSQNISHKAESCHIVILQLQAQKISGSCSMLHITSKCWFLGLESLCPGSIHSFSVFHRVCSCRARPGLKSHLVHCLRGGVCSWTNCSLRMILLCCCC